MLCFAMTREAHTGPVEPSGAQWSLVELSGAQWSPVDHRLLDYCDFSLDVLKVKKQQNCMKMLFQQPPCRFD